MTVIEADLKEFSAVKTRRAPWENLWELIARYIYQRKQGFTTVSTPGAFYEHQDVCDNTAGQAMHTAVSAIDGAIWKNGARTFRVPKPRQARDTQEIKDFYKEINARVTDQMEHEKAAFGTARLEALAEVVSFGTDAIGVFKAKSGEKHKVEYRALPLKNLYVVEDARGRVIKEFYEFEFNAFQLRDEYGEAALTEKVKKLLEKDDYETKLKVLWVVKPRADVKDDTLGPEKYSYESVHILEDEKMVIRRAGFNGNPIIVSRLYKNEGEEYGRGMGTNALSPTIELNGVVELLTQGGELTVFPSWYVLDDGTFGNGTIDRSAGKVIPIDVTSSKITGMAPIGPIGNVGSLTPLVSLIEWLTTEINAHFLVDKLTDLNNKTRMTLGEAQIRNELSSDSMGAIFGRQIDEKLIPVIRRTLSILEEEGELGVESGTPEYIKLAVNGRKPLVIPDELIELRDAGVEIYPIEFISPAARILRSEEVRGLISLWQFAAGFSGVKPELLLWLDDEATMPLVRDLYGAPDSAIVSREKFLARLKSYNDAQSMRSQLQAAQVGADVEAKKASANQQNAQAQATTGGMNGMVNNGALGYPEMAM
jgi:hypothetical protein